MRYRPLHIALAALVYLSSLGVVLHGHYCQEELRSLSVFWPAENCHEQAMPVDCPMHGKDSRAPADKDCCDDRADYLKDDQEAAPELPSPVVKPSITAAVLPAMSLPPAPGADRRSADYLHYKPPLLVCDRSVVLQTFLC